MRTTIEIQNLKCGGCEATVYKNLSKLKRLKDITIDVENSAITFDYDSAQDLTAVKEILLKIGYPVVGAENKLMTKAKSYVSCAMGRVNK